MAMATAVTASVCANDATATTAKDDILAGHGPPPARTRLYRHLDVVCMPLIEWACVAGLPTALLCARTFGLTSPRTASPSHGTCSSTESYHSFPWEALALLATSLVSLISILLFGDAQATDGTFRDHKRGTGIVVGSHLIPIFYWALQLSISCGGAGNDSYESADAASAGNGHPGRFRWTTAGGGHHLQFASLGGMAFAASCLFLQYNHRKVNWQRRVGVINGNDSDSLACSQRGQHSTMNLCWKCYLVLAFVFASFDYSFRGDDMLSTLLLGTLQIFLIWRYDRKPSELARNAQRGLTGAWQDAFTPGEWMAVSTFIASLVGEYFRQYSGIISHQGGVSFCYDSLPPHLIVAHAGLVGCIVGVTLVSLLKRCTDVGGPLVIGKLGLAVSILSVAGITIGFLEVALKSRLEKFGGLCQNSEPFSSILCSIGTPWSLRWLNDFLSMKLLLPKCATFIGNVSRVAVLGYWAGILALFLPLASVLALWIAAGSTSDISQSTKDVSCTRDMKQRVTLARKYFHFVAILLFTPITFIDSDMMALSYAIAAALLILLEVTVEAGIVETNVTSSWSYIYTIFLDEKDSSAAHGGLAVTHIALISGCALPLWVQQLLECTSMSSIKTLESPETLMPLLPFLGVLFLGIGDSAGAIGGIRWGHHSWPGGSSRTFEGSICMLLSMVFTMIACSSHCTFMNSSNCIWSFIFMCIIATLIEATTTQIDNLCLPVAGSTLMLLLASLEGISES
ncbi:hypothetical protein ACHAWF_007563 [Thalassiosira exigua]